jgi:uncharacterized membrane protein YagU involved in acid resistance
MSTASPDAPRERSWSRAIVVGGILAGVGDILFALIFYPMHGARPIRVLQSIAGGVQGREAFSGGWATAALGLALHFVIALGAAAVFCLAAAKLPNLLRRVWISGLAYGAVVWLVMNAVVVPLSALRGRFPPAHPWEGLVAHLFLVGLPIAFAARKFLAPGRT